MGTAKGSPRRGAGPWEWVDIGRGAVHTMRTMSEGPHDVPMLAHEFGHKTYVIRQKVLSLVSLKFHVLDPAGGLAFYALKKAFKLKEDLRVYADESMQREMLVIKARNIIDFAATYDVFDPNHGGQLVGSLRRKGLKSFVIDEWLFLDATGQQIGTIKEDSVWLALLRRLIAGWLLPQTYRGEVGGAPVCEFRRNFNPFVSKVTLDFSLDAEGWLDRRMGIAAALLLVGIEGKQDS